MNIQNCNYNTGITNTFISQINIPFSNIRLKTGVDSDVFIRSNDSINFTAKKSDKSKSSKKVSKSIEETLKNINGLHDPYSDVIMISSQKFKDFQTKIHKRNNAESMVDLLDGYTKHMFPSEKEVFEMFKNDIKEAKRCGKDSNLTLRDILQNNYVDAKARLVNSQMDVLYSIKELSNKKLNRDDKEYVDLYLSIIEKDIYNDHFRIKSSRELLRRLENELSDKKTAKEIIKLTKKFPNTATNSDAFIVKYHDKSPEEIAELLISPAQVSIEHIKPSSKNGADSPSNYLVASKRMNNYRSSLPLDELIEEYPNIPVQIQRYFDELIVRINRGGLPEIATTLFDVKDSLYEQSNGLIDVDISALSPQIVDKTNEIKSKVNELMEHFNQK